MKYFTIKTLILIFVVAILILFIGYNLGKQIKPISEIIIPNFKFNKNLFQKQENNEKNSC